MAAARWHPEAPRQTEQLSVSSHASSGSSGAGPEHRGVTEHVSPGCSATGPQQSGQIHRRVLTLLKSGAVVPEHSDEEDSPTSDERTNGRRVLSLLNSNEDNPPIRIEFMFLSGKQACCPMLLMFDPELSCGHLWWHLLAAKVDMAHKQLVVGSDVIGVFMKLALHPAVREQLQATPGVLRITVVHSC